MRQRKKVKLKIIPEKNKVKSSGFPQDQNEHLMRIYNKEFVPCKPYVMVPTFTSKKDNIANCVVAYLVRLPLLPFCLPSRLRSFLSASLLGQAPLLSAANRGCKFGEGKFMAPRSRESAQCHWPELRAWTCSDCGANSNFRAAPAEGLQAAAERGEAADAEEPSAAPGAGNRPGEEQQQPGKDSVNAAESGQGCRAQVR